MVAENVNSKNFTALYESAVRVNEIEEIFGTITFENSTTAFTTQVNGNLNLDGTINGVNLTEFASSVLKKTGAQDMISKRINGNMTVSSLTVNGSVNNLMAEDLVTKTTTQTIAGKKKLSLLHNRLLLYTYCFSFLCYVMTFRFVLFIGKTVFSNLHLLGNLVTGLVNGVNLSHLYETTLLKNTTNKQVITGTKTFSDEIQLGDIVTQYLVDGVKIDANAFVTLDTQQTIYGNITFSENFVSNHLIVGGKHKKTFSSNFLNMDKKNR